MSLKQKIVALSIGPLLLAVTLIGFLVIDQNRRLGEQQAQLIEQAILSSKRAELKNYVAMALNLIAPLRAQLDSPAAQQQALQALSRLSFGLDGYFFVYDRHGRNIMHPRQAELVGKDLWNMTDPHGLLAVQALLHTATQGDGFQRYVWQKPSTGQVTDKLAYVVMLEPWGWMLGIGIYLEDVAQATHQVNQEVASGIHTTLQTIGGVVLVAALGVFAGGLTLSVRAHRLADRQLQQINQRLLNLQEEERARVSRELHDGISQLLVSIKFQFELASHQLEAGQTHGHHILKQAINQLGAAIGEVRQISHDLRPSLLDTLGLSAAIEQLAADFEQRCALQIHCQLPDALHSSDRLNVALFRITQEALTNIERHAAASQVQIQLEQDAHHLYLQITDDGLGFDIQHLEQRPGGIGLQNIRERVEHLEGQFNLSSHRGQTRIRIVLPLSSA